ncbi:MarR family transcriptional regulator (plasmid) [Streptomyces sp. BHT-5-2]|uniref:MarR family winged helix-turn-helix transcriptional regulator n=1 Tax=unclassified Streptomyces TaxID=2593676 RepID=UPI001C8DA341|nr:MarR family transcriptional regulator [Streptomyces sp. BHT-5-2]QZL08383.1 MarR family transcriptional regulator [Streptomyces sp. BHT-5-2]
MANRDFPDELADVLAGIQRLIRRRLRPGLPSPRLRGAEVELLRLVAARPGIRVSAAARELYLAGNSVSTLVNRLSRAGYLSREIDPADRRSAQLFPTQEARTRLHHWETRRSALVRQEVACLSEAERTALEAALPALRRLAHNLHQQTEGP